MLSRFATASTFTSARRAASLQGPRPNVSVPRRPSGSRVALLSTTARVCSDIPPPTVLSQKFSLKDRVALVTGGNSGLGLEAALALAEAGARAVYTVDVTPTPGDAWTEAKEYAARLGAGGGGGGSRFEYVHADVRDQQRLLEIGALIGDKEGRLDVCFAAAGIVGPAVDPLDVTPSQLKDVFEVNVGGVLYTAQAAARQMVRFKTGGSIILVASLAAHVYIPGLKILPYSITKAGVVQMTRGLACDFAQDGIRVNSISPGFFNTPLQKAVLDANPALGTAMSVGNPLKRIAQTDELRGTVAWLASDASSYYTGSKYVVSALSMRRRTLTSHPISVALSGGHTAW